MLEHVPAWLGHLLQNARAGHGKLVSVRLALHDVATIQLMSPAFAGGAQMPPRFTADEEGVSPPLVWGSVSKLTQSLMLIVEDPDAPMPEPILHAVISGIPAAVENISEGDMKPGRAPGAISHNSFAGEGWLPPDPPTGHGVHDYVFQLFALDAVPTLDAKASRGDIVDALTGHVIGLGILVGQYWRGDAAQFEAVVPTAGSAPMPRPA